MFVSSFVNPSNTANMFLSPLLNQVQQEDFAVYTPQDASRVRFDQASLALLMLWFEICCRHCVHCGENRGSSVENIYEHNLKHVNIRPFVCKLCGESFLRNQQFVEHEKNHDKPPEEPVPKESKYRCKVCTLNYSNWKLFYKHQQESGHFNEKFLCEICGSEFHSNFLLSQHIRRLHKRTGEIENCQLQLLLNCFYFRWDISLLNMFKNFRHKAKSRLAYQKDSSEW